MPKFYRNRTNLGLFYSYQDGRRFTGAYTTAEVYLAYEAGAYPGFIGGGAAMHLAPYEIENIRIDGYDVVVNKPRVQAYRAPGASNAVFAAETVIDELCER